MIRETRSLKSRKFLIYTILFCLISNFLAMACILWDLVGQQVDQDVYSATHTAYSDALTENSHLATDDAYWNIKTWTEQAMTQQARDEILQGTPKPHGPPVITDLYLPSLISGDGTTFYGELYFSDDMGDVNRITIEVVRADNFEGADYDPRPYLVRGDTLQGVYQLYIWCQGDQIVTLRFTLYDSFGSKSNSKETTFTCD